MTYILPDINLLNKSTNLDSPEEHEQAAREGDLISEVSDALRSRLNLEDFILGPQVISYFFIPSAGVKARDLPWLEKDLQLETGAMSLTIHAPEPGTKFVKITVPRKDRRTIYLGDIL
jgi:S-DNA-T family DNA segregation ATPase FtsK/SpoIIIE